MIHVNADIATFPPEAKFDNFTCSSHCKCIQKLMDNEYWNEVQIQLSAPLSKVEVPLDINFLRLYILCVMRDIIRERNMINS